MDLRSQKQLIKRLHKKTMKYSLPKKFTKPKSRYQKILARSQAVDMSLSTTIERASSQQKPYHDGSEIKLPDFDYSFNKGMFVTHIKGHLANSPTRGTLTKSLEKTTKSAYSKSPNSRKYSVNTKDPSKITL